MSESERLPGGSAPERVNHLQKLWSRLPQEQQVLLGCRWVDLSVRSILAEGLERFGQPGLGAVLRTLPPITEPGAMQFVSASLTAMQLPNEPVEMLAAFFSVAASLKQLAEHFEIYECAFLAIMTSRLVHGDDRVLDSMLKDLPPTS